MPIDLVKSINAFRELTYNDSTGMVRIADLTRSTMGGTVDQIFRVFVPVKPERNRKMNSCYGSDFNIYLDTLFDYPTIIAAKMKNDWSAFNRFLSVNVGGCCFRCWYCFCDDAYLHGANCISLKPEKIVDRFVETRRKDYSLGISTNVLRISGGEPFLVPEFIMKCLERIKDLKLDKEVFLWCETNLAPFVSNSKSQKSLVEEHIDLRELSHYDNFALHPCLHGINPENLQESCGVAKSWFDSIINALRTLVDNRIDIYPTFGTNVSPPNAVENIFQTLYGIHWRLPQRIALIEYHFDYLPVLRREIASKKEKIYNRFLVVHKWNKLLLQEYDKQYAEVPRNEVAIW